MPPGTKGPGAAGSFDVRLGEGRQVVLAAVRGARPPVQVGSPLVSILVGGDFVRVFKSEDEALRWLLLKD